MNNRLYDHIHAWQQINAPVIVEQWITNGVTLPFHTDFIEPFHLRMAISPVRSSVF